MTLLIRRYLKSGETGSSHLKQATFLSHGRTLKRVVFPFNLSSHYHIYSGIYFFSIREE